VLASIVNRSSFLIGELLLGKLSETITPPTAPNSMVIKSGSPSSIPTIRAPMKALRMQVTEKPRESQMSPLSLMFAALLLLLIVGTSAHWRGGSSALAALKMSLVILTTFCAVEFPNRKAAS